MAPEQIFPAVATPIGGGRILPSPSAFYVTGEDRLRIVSANSAAGVSLKVQWRFVDAKGVIVPNSQDHVPNTDRTVKSSDYQLGVGQLLNVTVFAGAGTPNGGQTYVMVQLVRGLGAAAIVLGTLLGGYVTATQALGFPGSPILPSTSGEPWIRFIAGTTPAAGANFQETCPAGARWQLLSFIARLTTSAAVGPRTPMLFIASGGAAGAIYVPITSPAASQAFLVAWASGSSQVGDGISQAEHTGIGSPTLLRAGDVILSSVVGLQVGDQWSALGYYVREWLEVN